MSAAQGTSVKARATSSAARPASGNPFVALLKQIQPEVEQRLGEVLDEHVVQTRALGREVQALVREIRRLALLGGKRLRPALVVAGSRAAGGRGDVGPAL